MTAVAGWLLAAFAFIAGWYAWGWQGVVLALTLIAFWLILQFNRAVRIMRQAASAPVGYIDSAVMLNARLHRGMALWQVVAFTRSLGRPLDQGASDFAWADAGGDEVRLAFRRARLADWQLRRAELSDRPAPTPGQDRNRA